MPGTLLTEEQLRQIETALLGRTNIRPRSITGDKLASTLQSPNYSEVGGAEAGWQILQSGAAKFYELTIVGSIAGGTIDIGGDDATSFHVDVDGNMWLGDASFGSAPFTVSNAGAVTASDLTITGGSLSIGTGNTILKVNNDGDLWIGHATEGSAPFQVDNTGSVTASDLTVTGGSLSIGTGNAILKVNSTGDLWVGHATEASAPFQLGNDGLLRIKDGTPSAPGIVAIDLAANSGIYFENFALNDWLSVTMNGTRRATIGNGTVLTLTSSGTTYQNVTQNGAGGALYRDTSTALAKQNLRPYMVSRAKLLLEAPVVLYNSAIATDDQTIDNAGLIAEDLHDLGLSEFVTYDPVDSFDVLDHRSLEPNGIAYPRLVTALLVLVRDLYEQMPGPPLGTPLVHDRDRSAGGPVRRRP